MCQIEPNLRNQGASTYHSGPCQDVPGISAFTTVPSTDNDITIQHDHLVEILSCKDDSKVPHGSRKIYCNDRVIRYLGEGKVPPTCVEPVPGE